MVPVVALVMMHCGSVKVQRTPLGRPAYQKVTVDGSKGRVNHLVYNYTRSCSNVYNYTPDD